MLSLLCADFFQQYGLLIVLAVALGILMFISFNRRKREETNRTNLNTLIVPGAKVKTYGGIYGKVISIDETTDGKIVLLETGVGKNVSYQNIHINAIFGIDEKQPVVLDADGKEIFTDLNELEAQRLAKKEKQEKAEKSKQENVKEELKSESVTPPSEKRAEVKEVKNKNLEKKADKPKVAKTQQNDAKPIKK